MAGEELAPGVLVTGAGGFIGSHLTAALVQEGRRVRALDLNLERVRRFDRAGAVELIEGDVADGDVVSRSLEGVETVFHLAAAHLGTLCPESEYRRVNVDAVDLLVAASQRAGIRRFVHCSTVGVFGRLTDPAADEESPCRPVYPYERTKLEGERIVREAIRRDGFPAVIVRPTWVYGPGCSRTEKLFRAAAKGRLVVAGDAGTLRHCVYIKDMIFALQLAAATERGLGGVFIVGDEEAVPVRRLLEQLAQTASAPSPLKIPLGLLWLIAASTEAGCRLVRHEPPISRRSLRFFDGRTNFDTARARRVLGFHCRYDLSRGLRETFQLLSDRQPWDVRADDYSPGDQFASVGGLAGRDGEKPRVEDA